MSSRAYGYGERARLYTVVVFFLPDFVTVSEMKMFIGDAQSLIFFVESHPPPLHLRAGRDPSTAAQLHKPVHLLNSEAIPRTLPWRTTKLKTLNLGHTPVTFLPKAWEK